MITQDLRELILIGAQDNSKVSIGAGTVIIKDKQLLMVRSKNAKSLWKFPGGHLKNTESLIDAAKREALEETGYQVEVEGQPFVYEFDLNRELRLILFFYRAHIVDTGEAEQNDEIVETKWFDLDKVPENSFQNVKPVLKYLLISAE